MVAVLNASNAKIESNVLALNYYSPHNLFTKLVFTVLRVIYKFSFSILIKNIVIIINSK